MSFFFVCSFLFFFIFCATAQNSKGYLIAKMAIISFYLLVSFWYRKELDMQFVNTSIFICFLSLLFINKLLRTLYEVKRNGMRCIGLLIVPWYMSPGFSIMFYGKAVFFITLVRLDLISWDRTVMPKVLFCYHSYLYPWFSIITYTFLFSIFFYYISIFFSIKMLWKQRLYLWLICQKSIKWGMKLWIACFYNIMRFWRYEEALLRLLAKELAAYKTQKFSQKKIAQLSENLSDYYFQMSLPYLGLAYLDLALYFDYRYNRVKDILQAIPKNDIKALCQSLSLAYLPSQPKEILQLLNSFPSFPLSQDWKLGYVYILLSLASILFCQNELKNDSNAMDISIVRISQLHCLMEDIIKRMYLGETFESARGRYQECNVLDQELLKYIFCSWANFCWFLHKDPQQLRHILEPMLSYKTHLFEFSGNEKELRKKNISDFLENQFAQNRIFLSKNFKIEALDISYHWMIYEVNMGPIYYIKKREVDKFDVYLAKNLHGLYFHIMHAQAAKILAEKISIYNVASIQDTLSYDYSIHNYHGLGHLCS